MKKVTTILVCESELLELRIAIKIKDLPEIETLDIFAGHRFIFKKFRTIIVYLGYTRWLGLVQVAVQQIQVY